MNEYQFWKLFVIAFVSSCAIPAACTAHANHQVAKIAEKSNPIDAACAITAGASNKEMCIIRAQIKP
ncbi:hypothetical protein [Undibacterium sp.]|uniref:hypothetical protein n=1 Tax=Undibacterium sp. TaxID=1914977 RepID=UPI003751F91F